MFSRILPRVSPLSASSPFSIIPTTTTSSTITSSPSLFSFRSFSSSISPSSTPSSSSLLSSPLPSSSSPTSPFSSSASSPSSPLSPSASVSCCGGGGSCCGCSPSPSSPPSTSTSSFSSSPSSPSSSSFSPQRSFSSSHGPSHYVRVPATSAHESSESQYGYNSVDDNWNRYKLDPTQMSDPTGRTSAYLTIAAASVAWASLGRSTVHRFVAFWSVSLDQLAVAALEFDLNKVPEGQTSTIKWRGKPVFVRHRTEKEIAAAKADDAESSLRDPQKDADRIKGDPKWMVVIGVCTHLGCVPISAAGDWGGWFCPCHGSHYDTSGRIRKGPAPLNLAVPPYKFLTPTNILIGSE